MLRWIDIMNKDILRKLSVDELMILKEELVTINGVNKLKRDINHIINEEKINSRNSNNQILLTDLWFSIDTRKILEFNNIKTVEDLQNCSISSLEGINQITKEELNWAKMTYNFSHMDSKSLTKRIK